MSIWLFDCHQDEETFWRRMCPGKLIMLYNERFGIAGQKYGRAAAKSAEPRSLAAFFMGGG